MRSQASREKRRAATVAGTATALGVSLVGGALVLMLAGPPVQKPVALEPLTPTPAPTSAAPSPSPEPDIGSGDLLSMFGGDSVASLGGGDLGADTAAADLFAGQTGGAGAPAALPQLALPQLALPALPGGQLPALPSLPSQPAAPPFDWNAVLAPLIQAQNNAQAANVSGSVIGSVTGLGGAAINSAAVLLGDLILYAAYTSGGPDLLNQVQTALAAAAAGSAVAPGLQGLQLPPPPDLSGLNAAFAAAAASPPLGVPQLPPMPAGLPTPDEALAAIAAALPAVSAAGLPALPPPPELPPMPDLSGLFALPAIGIPQLPGPPQLPQLPKPEEVVGGVVGGLVAATIAGAVIGAIFQPPSLTRLMGLPF